MVEHISIYFFIAFKTHKYTYAYTHMHTRKNNANATATATAAHLSVIFIRCAQRVHKQGTLQQNMQSNIFGNPVCVWAYQSSPKWVAILLVIHSFRHFHISSCPAHMEAFADPTIFSLFIKFFPLCVVKSGRAERISLFIPTTHGVKGYYSFVPSTVESITVCLSIRSYKNLDP